MRERINRAGGIRTRGLFVPNEALYQAEPQPVLSGAETAAHPSSCIRHVLASKNATNGIESAVPQWRNPSRAQIASEMRQEQVKSDRSGAPNILKNAKTIKTEKANWVS